MSFRGLTLSVLFHLLLLLALTLWTELEKRLGLYEEPKKLITFNPVQDSDRINILLNNQETPNTPEDKRVFYTAQNKARVKEQTQARFIGPTVNRKFPSLMKPMKSQEESNERKSAGGAVDMNGDVATQEAIPKRNKTPLGISTLETQLSSQIKYGDFTALNTDQNLFFSFYTRIAPRIRFHWENGVDNVIESLQFKNLNIQNEKTFTTEVEVQLQPNGHYVKTAIYRSSGIAALDNAVIRSFELATPFVNPPQEMVRDDGLIHLYYSFSVHYSPSIYARP